MRYQPSPPPQDPDRFQAWIVDQLRLIGFALDALYNGEVENTTEDPEGNDPVLIFSDGDLDFGDGAGMYLRLEGDAWYKLTMQRVHPMRPKAATLTISANAPTIS